MSNSFLNIFSNPDYDFEFIGFRLNDRHSSEFGLTVVSSSGLTQEELFASFNDKTVEVSGKDGVYYFGTEIKTKEFSIQLAFDHLTSQNYRDIKEWLNPKRVQKLVFDERPYKYYWVKVSTPPVFSYVPFEEEIEGDRVHIFKGELTINFISHSPYGYSDTSLLRDVTVYNPEEEDYKPYVYGNYPGWYLESGLFDEEATNVVSAGNNSFPIVNSGYIQKAGTNASFYNCGVIESYPVFSFTIDAFNNSAEAFQLTDVTTEQVFEISSLLNIPAIGTNATLNAATSWTISCNPEKGMVTGTVLNNSFNLGSIHNGEFLHLDTGDNILSVNKTIGNLAFSFKNIYW